MQGRVGLWLVWLVTGSTLQGQNWLTSHSPFLFSNLLESAAFVSSTTMAPQLDAAQHILIETLLKEEFETKLIALKASCSVRAVQRIRLKRQQFEMPTPRTNRVGRRSCITSPMQGALCDKLIEQSYLYRCEMADFSIVDLVKEYRKDRSVGLCDQ